MELVRRLLAALLVALAPTLAWAQGSTSTSPGMLCPSIAKISQTANAQVITGTANQKLYICAIVLANQGTAQNVNVVEGTGTTCGTGTVGLLGGATAATGVGLAVNGSLTAVARGPWLKTITAGDNLCVVQSGTTQLSGVITYRSAP